MIDLKKYGIELDIVRHGEYLPTKVGGWTDDHLSNNGVKQIESLIEQLDDNYDIFISSDLNRAKESADILNKKLQMNIVYDFSIREINSGILNDMSIEDFYNKYPGMFFQTLEMDESFPEGESPNSFYERVKNAFIRILDENRNKKILMVTHGGVITIIYCLLNGYKYSNKMQIDIKTGSITKFR